MVTQQPSPTPDGEPCPICYTPFPQITFLASTSCQHTYCHHCLGDWIDTNDGPPSCPLCRASVTEYKITWLPSRQNQPPAAPPPPVAPPAAVPTPQETYARLAKTQSEIQDTLSKIAAEIAENAAKMVHHSPQSPSDAEELQRLLCRTDALKAWQMIFIQQARRVNVKMVRLEAGFERDGNY